jgi:hypothetical protein
VRDREGQVVFAGSERFLKDHMQLKESMKLYFLIHGKYLANSLLFLHNAVNMGDYIYISWRNSRYLSSENNQEKRDVRGTIVMLHELQWGWRFGTHEYMLPVFKICFKQSTK